MVKVMMGKYAELAHVPKNARDIMAKLLAHSKVNRSVDKLSDFFSGEVVDKLSDDKDQANIHEGFEPKLAIQDVIKKYAVKATDYVLSTDNQNDFQQF